MGKCCCSRMGGGRAGLDWGRLGLNWGLASLMSEMMMEQSGLRQIGMTAALTKQGVPVVI